jgi:hypothetical protein
MRAMPALSAAAIVVFGVVLAVDLTGDSSARNAGTASREAVQEDRDSAEYGGTDSSAGSGAQADAAPSTAARNGAGDSAGTPAQGLVPAPEGAFEDAPADGESSAGDDSLGGAPTTPNKDQQVSTANNVESDSSEDDAWLRVIEIAALAIALGAGALALWTWRQRRGAHQ